MELSSSDYKKIVDFYKVPKQNNMSYKTLAEDILADKLCKCIKSVKKKPALTEKSAIGICRNSIFKKRNMDFYTFECKKEAKLREKKNTKRRLKKFSKKIGFNKTVKRENKKNLQKSKNKKQRNKK